MKTIKKILIIAYSLLMMINMTACSDKKADTAAEETSSAETTAETAAETTEPKISLSKGTIGQYLSIDVSYDTINKTGAGLTAGNRAETNAIIETYPYKAGKFEDLTITLKIIHPGWQNSDEEMTSVEKIKVPYDGKVSKKIKLVHKNYTGKESPEFTVIIEGVSVSGAFIPE